MWREGKTSSRRSFSPCAPLLRQVMRSAGWGSFRIVRLVLPVAGKEPLHTESLAAEQVPATVRIRLAPLVESHTRLVDGADTRADTCQPVTTLFVETVFPEGNVPSGLVPLGAHPLRAPFDFGLSCGAIIIVAPHGEGNRDGNRKQPGFHCSFPTRVFCPKDTLT